jgi:hypothetical protein
MKITISSRNKTLTPTIACGLLVTAFLFLFHLKALHVTDSESAKIEQTKESIRKSIGVEAIK